MRNSKEIIINAFERFLPKEAPTAKKPITTAFLMSLGLSGTKDSALRRKYPLEQLKLPTCISPATLKKVLGDISSEEEITNIMKHYK